MKSQQLENSQTIDFRKFDSNLFSGRKNGERAQTKFQLKAHDYYIFIAHKEQLITSSYFLGLMSHELKRLSEQEHGNINNLIERLNTDGLNEKSTDECLRAVKRSITPTKSLLD